MHVTITICITLKCWPWFRPWFAFTPAGVVCAPRMCYSPCLSVPLLCGWNRDVTLLPLAVIISHSPESSTWMLNTCISQHLHALTWLAQRVLGLTQALPPSQQVLHSNHTWFISGALYNGRVGKGITHLRNKFLLAPVPFSLCLQAGILKRSQSALRGR